MKTAKTIGSILFSIFAMSCDEGNTSGVSADYDTLRVKQLALSDSAGKTVVIVTAERRPNGVPSLVVRDPKGTVLKSIEIDGRPQ